MKNIIPALNKLQIACQDRKAPLSDIAKARKELFAAIRESFIELLSLENEKENIANESFMLVTKKQTEYLAKFDKLNS